MNRFGFPPNDRRRAGVLVAALASLGVVLSLAPSASGSEAKGGDSGARASAAAEQSAGKAGFRGAASRLERELRESQKRLSELRELISDEKIPLSKRINELETALRETRSKFQQKSRTLDSRALELNNLRSEIDSRKKEADYLRNLLSEYARNFESRLHIAERDRHADTIEKAKRAADAEGASRAKAFRRQAELVSASLDRLEAALGGVRFEGEAVGPEGLVKDGRFLLLGPVAFFRSGDGAVAGTAAEQLNSNEPTVRPFRDAADAKAVRSAVAGRGDRVPLDPTLGKAHKVEETRAGLWAHIQKGGPVMVPIFALAGASLLVALYKWIALSLHRKPSQKRINDLLRAVREKQGESEIRERLNRVPGPAGRMLAKGVAQMNESRELIEEVMYEHVLDTRLKLNRLLPFVAITAASAPLLGLLGTVTGIINTFELITAFGTGDVQTLSGGISEALVTTEFGLIVAIPSLLLHAFLSRKARGITDQMEKAAVAFGNEIVKARGRDAAPAEAA